MLQQYIRALADPSVIVKTYRTPSHGVTAVGAAIPAFLGAVAGN